MSDVTEKPDARETVDRWESTEAFTAMCNAVDAIEQLKERRQWSIADVNGLQDVLLSQGFEVRQRDTGSKAWESLASSMRPYTELVFVTLLAVEAGELSEGRAVEMLKINHVELREIRHGLITSLVEFAGQCKSPLTSLLGTITGRQDSSETSMDRPSSNSRGTGA